MIGLVNGWNRVKGLTYITREPPIFIVGCGRSGTTLLLSVISSDEKFYCMNYETEVFKLGFLSEPGPAGILWRKVDTCSTWKARTARMKLLAAAVKQSAATSKQRCIVEKTPIHIRTISCIRKAYSGSVRFVHIVRDGRDVVTSLHPSNPGQFHIHPERWVYDVGITESCRNEKDTVVIRYEDLVTDFRSTISKIYDRFQMEIPESVFDYQENASVRKHVAWATEVKDLSSHGIGRWRDEKYRDQVLALLKIPDARKLLDLFEYEI